MVPLAPDIPAGATGPQGPTRRFGPIGPTGDLLVELVPLTRSYSPGKCHLSNNPFSIEVEFEV